MKKSILGVAFILYILGVAVIVDWITFCEKNNELSGDFIHLKAKYISRFPNFIQPFFNLNPQPAAVFFGLGFIAAGSVFIRQNHKAYKVLAITSFAFGAWNLFSIM
jgi:hypothetical protein